MLTRAAFRSSYPEFDSASDALVDAKLAEAERSIDATVWSDLEDDGHGNLTAHLLVMSPYGKDMRLESDDTKSTYGERYRELAERVGRAYRVVLE